MFVEYEKLLSYSLRNKVQTESLRQAHERGCGLRQTANTQRTFAGWREKQTACTPVKRSARLRPPDTTGHPMPRPDPCAVGEAPHGSCSPSLSPAACLLPPEEACAVGPPPPPPPVARSSGVQAPRIPWRDQGDAAAGKEVGLWHSRAQGVTPEAGCWCERGTASRRGAAVAGTRLESALRSVASA